MLPSTNRQKGTTRQAANRVSLTQKVATDSLIERYPSSPYKVLRAGWKKQQVESSQQEAVRKQGGTEAKNRIQRYPTKPADGDDDDDANAIDTTIHVPPQSRLASSFLLLLLSPLLLDFFFTPTKKHVESLL